MIQFALALFGISALWMATGRSLKARQWAPIVGLAGQPFWLIFAYQAQAWGMGLISIAYTAVFIRAAWVQFGPKQA